MNRTSTTAMQSPAGQGLSLRKSPIAAACAALFAVSAPALAQQAAPASDQQLEEITVTGAGFRKSIEDAVSLKRNSDEVVEAISAEDLGKMPDVSIGEALARLPGVTAQRVNGRAQVIDLRGMGPDFTGTTLNGREMVTTGDNRAVEFDQFPAELLNSVLVYKTEEAGHLGAGLAGTVDMRALRPLDMNEREFALNARLENNHLGDVTPEASNKGQRVSVSYVDQLADHTVGVALGLAYLSTPTLTQKQQIWGYDQNANATNTSWGLVPKNLPAADINAVFPNGDQIEAIYDDNKRLGAMAVLEFKPNKDLHSTVDLYYSKFTQNEYMDGLFWYQGVWDGNPNNISNPVFSTLPDGEVYMKSATITDLNSSNGSNGSGNMIVRNDYNQRNDKIESIGWNTAYQMGPWLTSLDLSHSMAHTVQSLFETYSGTSEVASPSPLSVTYNLPTDPNQVMNAVFIPNTNFTNPATTLLGDPAGYNHDGRQQIIDQRDTINAIRLGGKYDFSGALKGVFHDVDLGLNYSERKKERGFDVQFAYLNNYVKGGTSQQVASDLLYSPASLAFAGVPGVLSYNVQGVAARYYNMIHVLSQSDLQQPYTVNEKVTTGYFRFDIDSEVARTPIRGNIGAELIHTDQSSQANNTKSNGNDSYGDGIGEITGTVNAGTTYNDVLPSLNLIAELPDEYVARFGVGKQMARPRMDLMKAASSASVGNNPNLWSGSGGNPYLKPWRAKAVDLSLEKYFGKRSYVAVAAFYKHLDSWVTTQTVPFNFSGYTDSSGNIPLTPYGFYQTPVNQNGGEVHGGEFSASLDFSNLSRSLDGFGMLFSESITQSSVRDVPDPTQQYSGTPNLPLPGLSHTVRNWTFFYEKDGLSMRVAEHYRSEFRGETIALFGTRQYPMIMADKQYDAQASYTFENGAYKNLSLLLQVNNLTNAPYRQTQQYNNMTLPMEFDLWGRSVLLGVTYKFN